MEEISDQQLLDNLERLSLEMTGILKGGMPSSIVALLSGQMDFVREIQQRMYKDTLFAQKAVPYLQRVKQHSALNSLMLQQGQALIEQAIREVYSAQTRVSRVSFRV